MLLLSLIFSSFHIIMWGSYLLDQGLLDFIVVNLPRAEGNQNNYYKTYIYTYYLGSKEFTFFGKL